jgi:hypothetical protein
MRERHIENAGEIKIYKCRHIPTFGSPIALMAVGRDDDHLIGEVYILFGDGESSFLAERVKVRPRDFAESDPRFKAVIDQEFLLDSMRDRAESQINERVFVVAKVHAEVLATLNWFELAEGTVRDLLSLYLRGNYSEHLKRAAQQTRFSDLCRLFNRFDILEGFSVERVATDSEEGT